MTQRRKLENYMKTIYLLQQKGAVRGADIADVLKQCRGHGLKFAIQLFTISAYEFLDIFLTALL